MLQPARKRGRRSSFTSPTAETQVLTVLDTLNKPVIVERRSCHLLTGSSALGSRKANIHR